MLKGQLTTLEGLDVGLASHYSKIGDVFVLQAEGFVSAAELDSLKTQLQEVKAESIDRRKELGLWQTLGKSADEVRQKLSDAAKGKNPDHEAVVSQMTAAHAAALAESNNKYTQMVRRGAEADLKSELAKVGVVPQALEALAALASQNLQFEGDGFRVVANGKPMIGTGADGGATLADLASSIAKIHTYAVKDGGKGGGGTPTDNKGGTPGKTMSRADFERLGPVERAETVKGGTAITN